MDITTCSFYLYKDDVIHKTILGDHQTNENNNI